MVFFKFYGIKKFQLWDYFKKWKKNFKINKILEAQNPPRKGARKKKTQKQKQSIE
jgi:hypothetical protein